AEARKASTCTVGVRPALTSKRIDTSADSALGRARASGARGPPSQAAPADRAAALATAQANARVNAQVNTKAGGVRFLFGRGIRLPRRPPTIPSRGVPDQIPGGRPE